MNNTVNESVGEAPHFLLYGYDKRMPVNILDDAPPPQRTYNYDDYISFCNRLAYNTIQKSRKLPVKSKDLSKHYYDQKAQNSNLKIGTQVYLKKHVPEGPNHKISPIFDGTYRIMKF